MSDSDHGLGRLVAPDARDAKFPFALAPRFAAPAPVTRYWTTGGVLDQGATSQCVAYAWKQCLQSSPLRQARGVLPQGIYQLAQERDEWPEQEPAMQGTSVRAGAKVLQLLGFLSAYVWAGGADDVVAWVQQYGPVVLGTDWHEEMFRPGADGFVRPVGPVAGGHAYTCYGYEKGRDALRCINSWGAAWGQGGRFWLARADLEAFLASGGEACAPTETRL